jgi:predicted transcriptional regulator
MTDTEDISNEIMSAKTLDELTTIEGKLSSMQLGDSLRGVFSNFIQTCRDKIAREKGTFFEDAQNLYELRVIPSSEEVGLTESFSTICRHDTPDFYEYIKVAAEMKNTAGKLQQVCTKSLGSNSEYPKGDIFGRHVDPSRAHIFLDSPSCGPAWGHMAEGATGIINMDDEDEKNQIRVIRMMGGKKNESKCLRRDIHNFVPLHSDHRTYYDANPQLMLLPNLSLSKIKDWKEDEPYDVLVFVASPHKNVDGLTCAEIYRTVLANFDWDKFNDQTDICSEKELDDAFKVLRHFITALAHSLKQQIPQTLLDLPNLTKESSKNNNSNNKKKKGGKRPPPSPSSSRPSSPSGSQEEEGKPKEGEWMSKKEELEKAREELEKEFSLPFRSKNASKKPRRPVLKVFLNGPVYPDPWLLMIKAAVNFSWIAYGYKLLPACLPPQDNAIEEYEQALLEYEERQRERDDIPTELSILATPAKSIGDGRVATVTPPIASTPTRCVHSDGGEEMWETLSDPSD